MTTKNSFTFGHWEVVCCPEDGARLDSLRFNGIDLLTTEPDTFKPPEADYGQYELRPVYGYDDCLPTVDPCTYPDGWEVPDHGEVCWRQWQEALEPNELVCSVHSQALPLRLTRHMRFSSHRLTWLFQVVNDGPADLPIQHVMHPLMPIRDLETLSLPAAQRVVDAVSGETLVIDNVRQWLQERPQGEARMLLLQQVDAGSFSLHFKTGLQLEVAFPLELFPTIGIWWNHDGYPDEDGCRRNEFAVEPIPGSCSNLEAALADQSNTLTVPAAGHCEWSITWDIRTP